MESRSHVPPGWIYNPSAWSQRLWIVSVALVAFLIATYLALWQYELVDRVWEPFFGPGTEIILSSELSWILPFGISDAALGAFAYLLDAAVGVTGGRDRWRTMPWAVVLFAILIGPVGFVSTGLVIAQPVLYGQWCTLCIATAVMSIAMIGPAMDEALACLQHLRRVRRDPGRNAWRAFWGREAAGTPIEPGPLPAPAPPAGRRAARWNTPLDQMARWPHGLVALVGAWLMVAPGLLPFTEAASTNDRVVGPLIAALGCIAMWEATRPLRWLNVALGAWLVVAPWILDYATLEWLHSMAAGGVVMALGCVRGRIRHAYAGGWSSLWRDEGSSGNA